MDERSIKYIVFLWFLILVQVTSSNPNGAIQGKKTAEAVRIKAPPVIDGSLKDEAWKSAKPAGKFIQYFPYNGQSPSYETEVKIIYDDNAVYVGAMMFDPFPDSIFTELSERDDFDMVDQFGVYFDCFNDYLTAYGFFVSAAGVQQDKKSTSSGGEDESWDAVWLSEVSIVENGWIAEFEIPYSALRFPKKEVQEWGLQFYRVIMRYRETSTWNLINREEDGINNQSGKLVGIEHVKPPLRLSFVPYVSGYLEKSPEAKNWGYSYNVGLDLKIGLNESYTLDMTLIPDFGQVQSDDIIYNLSPFEVYYSEQRPFFMEGTELFDKGNVFYSRRIGKTPSGYFAVNDSLIENETIKENPQYAQLINSTKISGKSTGNLAVGFFNGVTANTHATIEDTATGASRQVLTEPFTNYNMLVFDQALRNNSYFSIFNTNTFQPDKNYAANVTGGELRLANRRNTYGIWSQGIVSQKYNKNLAPEFGYLYSIVAGKISGNFTFEFSHDVIDDKYDPNDMGFLRYNNFILDNLRLSYNIYQPVWKILDMSSSIWFRYEQLYNPRRYAQYHMGFRLRTRFENHLSVWMNSSFSPVKRYDFYEPRVDGRYFTVNPYISADIGFSPDYRKRFLIDWRAGYFKSNYYNEYSYWFSIAPRIRLNDHLRMVFRFEYDFDGNNTGYVTDSLFQETTPVIIFGSRDINTYETTININYRFNNKSSIQFRLRHYWIYLRYNDFFDLDMKGGLLRSEYNEIKDFSNNIFNIDTQYIWNFAPGSEIRIVWKNAINTFEEPELINSILVPVENRFGKNLVNTIQSPANNSFSVKVLYFLDYQHIKRGFRSRK